MAIQSLYPRIAPSLNLDFANTKTLDPRITFTRASTATFFNQNGVLQTAAVNTPRFDHNPITGESLGLLIEEQRTNFFTHSTEFDHASWGKVRSGIIANQMAAPDGTLSADKLVANTDNSTHMLTWSLSSTSGTYTASIYVKAAEYSVFTWEITDNVTGNISLLADLQSQTAIVGHGGSWTGITGSLTPAGNGWFRASISGVQGAGTGLTCILLPRNAAGSVIYVGDNLSGIYIWGAQLEHGAFPTSYIPTVASQVTRLADAAAMTGANFSSWYRQDEGAFAVESASFLAPATHCIASVDDGTTSNRIGTYTTGAYHIFISTGGVVQAEGGAGSHAAGVITTAALAYKLNDSAVTVGGAAPLTDSSCSIPTVDRLRIGNSVAGEAFIGHIRKLAYYPARLSNAQLQALTT